MDALTQRLINCSSRDVPGALDAVSGQGFSAIPALRASIDAQTDPVKALRLSEAIEVIRAREGARKPPTVSWTEGEPLGEVAERISRTMGTRLMLDDVDGDQVMKSSRSALTLLQALATLCREQGDCSWRSWETGEICLQRAPAPRYPAAHDGPFCTRVTNATTRIETDFKKTQPAEQTKLAVDLELLTIAEDRLFPLDRTPITDVEATDDRGNALRIEVNTKRPDSLDDALMWRPDVCTITGFAPDATSIRNLRGSIRFRIAVGSTPIVIEHPGDDSTVRTGRLKLRIINNVDRGFVFEETSRDERYRWTTRYRHRHLRGEQFEWRHAVLVDSQGVEYPYHMTKVLRHIESTLGSYAGVVYRVYFDTNHIRKIKARNLRLRYIGEAIEETRTFCFDDIPLPCRADYLGPAPRWPRRKFA